MVVIVSLLLGLLISLFIPPMMTLLVQAEHQTYLARASNIGSIIIPLLGQTPLLLLTSLSIDGVVWLGKRGQWSSTKQKMWGIVASTVTIFLVTGYTLVQLGLHASTAQGSSAKGFNMLALVLALILAVPGSLLGGWMGLTISDIVQGRRR